MSASEILCFPDGQISTLQYLIWLLRWHQPTDWGLNCHFTWRWYEGEVVLELQFHDSVNLSSLYWMAGRGLLSFVVCVEMAELRSPPSVFVSWDHVKLVVSSSHMSSVVVRCRPCPAGYTDTHWLTLPATQHSASCRSALMAALVSNHHLPSPPSLPPGSCSSPAS